jgi:hypothetical protein
MPHRFFSDCELIQHFNKLDAPLPFSLSSLRKDRITGQLGGVPYRRVGGSCIYNPKEVTDWLCGRPIIQPGRTTKTVRKGAPTKAERVEAERRGISVKELREGGAA